MTHVWDGGQRKRVAYKQNAARNPLLAFWRRHVETATFLRCVVLQRALNAGRLAGVLCVFGSNASRGGDKGSG